MRRGNAILFSRTGIQKRETTIRRVAVYCSKSGVRHNNLSITVGVSEDIAEVLCGSVCVCVWACLV
jgi:hypothetical protein